MQRHRLGEKLEQKAPIVAGPDDRVPLVAATRGVPDRTGMFQAKGTCHKWMREANAGESGSSVGGEKVPRTSDGSDLFIL
jgi:hypothetical protein